MNSLFEKGGQPKHYLALGDSYTIGESVPREDSFPFILIELLSKLGYNFFKPTVIAKTGWTTDELLSAIDEAAVTAKFDMVTLLIGVNNQYRGYSLDTYRQEFVNLLNRSIDFAAGDAKRVFVLSIPDWGLTPFGHESGRSISTISDEIDSFNTIKREECFSRGVKFVDITADTKLVEQDVMLLCEDRLHYSRKMHKIWAERLIEAAKF